MFKLLKPLSAVIGPERAHKTVLLALRLLGMLPFGRWMMRKCSAVEHPALEREVFGIHFKNPIGVAAGFDRNADAYRELSALGFGFVEVGTITPRPQTGNPKPRVFRLDDHRAILYRTGIANKGLERAITRLRVPHEGTVVGCNIGKNAITPVENQPADYLKVFRNLYQYVDYFTVHIAFNSATREYVPQSKENILAILTPLFEFRRGQNQYCPILLKVSPDLPDEVIDDMTDIMLETPLDGLVAVNATVSREMASKSKLPALGFVSGPSLTKRSIEIVRRIHERSQGTYPIIGVGGLMSPEDIKAMFDAGATLVQLYTGVVYEGMKLVRDACKMLIADAEQAEREAKEAERRAAEEASATVAETPRPEPELQPEPETSEPTEPEAAEVGASETDER